jgi:hypothetical protein
VHFAAGGVAHRDGRREIPNLDIEIDRGVEQARGDIRQVQGRAAEAADLELGEHSHGHGEQRLVRRAVEPDKGFGVGRPGRDGRRPIAIMHPEPRAAVHQHPSAEVINDAVDRLPPFDERQRNRALGYSQRKIIRPVDRVEHPGEPRRDRNRAVRLRQFLAEELIAGEPRPQFPEYPLRDGDIRRRDPGAVALPPALDAAKLPVHEFGLGEHRPLRRPDAAPNLGIVGVHGQ